MVDRHEKRVLLVDDNALNLKYREYRLVQAGFCVVAASNGFDALRIAKLKKPDIVVTDIRMAGMDGFVLCRELRDLYDVPVILYSAAEISQGAQEYAKAIGASAVLNTSTYDMSKLINSINELLL